MTDNLENAREDQNPDFNRNISGMPRIKGTASGAIGSQILRVFKPLRGRVTAKEAATKKLYHGLKQPYEFVGKIRDSTTLVYVPVTGGNADALGANQVSNFITCVFNDAYLDFSNSLGFFSEGDEYHIVFFEFTYE